MTTGQWTFERPKDCGYYYTRRAWSWGFDEAIVHIVYNFGDRCVMYVGDNNRYPIEGLDYRPAFDRLIGVEFWSERIEFPKEEVK